MAFISASSSAASSSVIAGAGSFSQGNSMRSRGEFRFALRMPSLPTCASMMRYVCQRVTPHN